LWRSWGGAPTTQLLRIQDNRIDKHTKKRYHEKLQINCPVIVVPHLSMETNNSQESDEVYQTWTKYLISKTRDGKKFPLLLKDDTSYGFRRNVWGLKPHGLAFTIIFILANYFFWVIRLKSFNPLFFPNTFKYSTLMLFAILVFWLLIVTKNWVKLPAFSYAERLCECVESL
jgi:hypothetical protein